MPAAVGVFVAAVGGWGAAIALVISIAAGAYMVIKARGMSAGTQQERKQILRSSAAPHNVIYGKNRSAGVLCFAEEAKVMIQHPDTGAWIRGKEDGLFLAITHASHPLHKVEKYELNGEKYEDFTTKYALFTTHKDGASVADPILLRNAPSWKADMIGKGFAWYSAQMVFDQKKFPNGLPNINAIKWGWEVYDPRTHTSAWSDNPILAVLHYLKYYMGYSDDEIIYETFINAANVCDEFVTLPDGSKERRYTLGAEFNIDFGHANVLDRMLSTCGGEWMRVGGRLGITVAAYYGPATISIGEDDLIGDVELQPEVERQDSINTIRGKFVSPAQSYTEVDYPQVSVPEYVTEDGEEIISDLNLEWVQSPWQCQRLAHIAIMRNRFGMQCRLPCNLRGFKAVPGTLIKLNLESIGVKNQEFRVLDWEFSINGGVVLVVRRDLASMYNDAVGKPLDVPPLIPDTGDVAVPTNLRFETDISQDTVSGVLRWENKAALLAHTEVIVKEGENIKQTIQVPSPGISADLVGLGAGVYTIDFVSVTVAGRRSPVATLSIRLQHPVAPSHADADKSSNSITIMPHIGDDSQISINTIYEFYFNAVDDQSTAQRLGQGKMLTKQGLAADTKYWFWVYTITPLGKSPTPLALMVKTDLISSDIIDHIDKEVDKKVAAATDDLLKRVGSLTDIRGIAEDLDAQIMAEYIAKGLSELEAKEAAKKVARLMSSVKELSTDQQSLVEQVTTLYAKFDEQVALVQTKDRAQVGYSLKPDGSPGKATTPKAAEEFGELWVPGKALAESVKLVGIVTGDGRTLTVSQYFSALETAGGKLSARAFLGVDHNGRITGIGITSDDDGKVTFQAINFIADVVSITSPDDPKKMLLWYDTRINQLTVRGKMILGDGYVVDGEGAIRAKDGGTWETRYKLSATVPDTPTGRFPVGWGTAMPTPTADKKTYASTAFIKADDTIGITWSVPGRISGNNGNDGAGGNWVDYRFKRSKTVPPKPSGNTPAGWTDGPTVGTDPLYMIKGTKTTAGNLIGTWSTPVRMDGEAGADGKSLQVQWSIDGSTAWHDVYKAGDKYMRQRTEGGTWSAAIKVVGENGAGGNWVDYRFKRSKTVPPKPSGNTPAGWTDGPPPGTDPLYMIKGTKTTAGNLIGTWSTPVRMDGEAGADGKSLQVQWSVNGTSWHDAYQPGDKYMRQRTEGGTWSAAIKVVGEDGTNGNDGFQGAGFYRLVTASGNWPGDGAANGLFKTAFGRYPVRDDVLTFFKTDGSVSTTKRCSDPKEGTNAVWAAAALLLHGDMIALGTISGNRITANTEISAPFIRGGRIEIGGAGGTFAVGINGAVSIKSAGTKARMEIINDRLQVYDDQNQLAVRIGRLS